MRLNPNVCYHEIYFRHCRQSSLTAACTCDLRLLMTNQSNFVSTLLPLVPTDELTPLLHTALRQIAADDVRLPEVSVSDRVFRSTDVAFASLYKTIAPGHAVAVRIGNERAAFNHPANRTYQKLSTRLSRATAAEASYIANIVEREVARARHRQDKTGRVSLHECKHCASKVNLLTRVVKAIEEAAVCPSCSKEFLMTKRDKKRYMALVQQRDEATQALVAAKTVHEAQFRPPAWVVLENRLPPAASSEVQAAST